MQRELIKDLAEQIRGVSYKPEDLHKDLNEDSVILLRANNIDNGMINFDDVVYVDKSKVSQDQYLKTGDILICASSGSKQLVGKAASIEFDKPCTFGAFCKVVRPRNGWEKYLGAFFQSDIYRQRISALSIGSNINNIRNEHIDSLVIPLHTEELRKSAIKEIDLLNRIIRKRKTMLQSLDLLIKARFVELFENDCQRMKLSDVCSIITDGTHQPPKFVSDGIPFIFVANIIDNKVTYDAEKFIDQSTYDELIKRTPIEIGDVLLSTVGSYGHPAVVKTDKKFLFQRHIAYLKPKKDIIDSDYLHGAILSPDVQRQIEEGVKGIAQKTLNLTEVKKMTIPVPDINKQKKFASFVAQIDKSKVVVPSKIKNAIFAIMLSVSFGQITSI